MAPKKKAHDPTTQIGRLLKNAISVIIVGRKKNLEKPHPSLKDKKKRFEFSPFENSFNFHTVFEFSYLFFIGDDFRLF